MATKSKSGFLPLLLVGAVIVAVVGVSDVKDFFSGLLTNDPVIIDRDGTAIMVASGQKSKVDECTPQQVIDNRRCGDTKIVVIDAARMPHIALNISSAWREGHPAVLHRDSAAQAANRAAACGEFVPKYGGSCDEYAFATTQEGGEGSRTEEVHIREQRCQGGAVNASYSSQNIAQGEGFLVVIASPSLIPDKPFSGTDIAKDRTAC